MYGIARVVVSPGELVSKKPHRFQGIGHVKRHWALLPVGTTLQLNPSTTVDDINPALSTIRNIP